MRLLLLALWQWRLIRRRSWRAGLRSRHASTSFALTEANKTLRSTRRLLAQQPYVALFKQKYHRQRSTAKDRFWFYCNFFGGRLSYLRFVVVVCISRRPRLVAAIAFGDVYVIVDEIIHNCYGKTVPAGKVTDMSQALKLRFRRVWVIAVVIIQEKKQFFGGVSGLFSRRRNKAFCSQ